MKEYFRIVIDVPIEKQGAFYIFNHCEGMVHSDAKRGRVALYRIHKVHLEKAVVERAQLIEARTVE